MNEDPFTFRLALGGHRQASATSALLPTYFTNPLSTPNLLYFTPAARAPLFTTRAQTIFITLFLFLLLISCARAGAREFSSFTFRKEWEFHGL